VAVPVLHPVPLGDGVVDYGDRAPEFRLYRADPTDEPIQLPGSSGPRIVFCVGGAAVLRSPVGAAAAADPDQLHTAKLAHGESAFLPATDAQVTATGPARLFVAACGV
jgi:mannose-6-phosphate isomerase